MKFQIGELVFSMTPKSFSVTGKVESTPIEIHIQHMIFSGDTTSISIKVGEMEITGKI
jgi:hypothetical protein